MKGKGKELYFVFYFLNFMRMMTKRVHSIDRKLEEPYFYFDDESSLFILLTIEFLHRKHKEGDVWLVSKAIGSRRNGRHIIRNLMFSGVKDSSKYCTYIFIPE